MNPLIILKIIDIAAKAAAAGKDVKETLGPVLSKLKAVHAEGRELTPAEFEEVEAGIVAKHEELHR